jgi:hypothetical protein
MKRAVTILLSSLLLIALMLAGCSTGSVKRWGELEVQLVHPQSTDRQWTADMKVINKSGKQQTLRYNGTHRYTMVVKQGSKEIFRESFMKLNGPSALDLLPGAEKSHVVGWNYVDQSGKKVASGTYEVKVELHGAAAGVQQGVVMGPVKVEVK